MKKQEYVQPEVPVLDEELSYPYMNVGQLKKAIANMPDETEVWIRTCHNPTGNMVEAGAALQSEYGFLGSPIQCVIIEPSFIGYLIDNRIKDKRRKDFEAQENSKL